MSAESGHRHTIVWNLLKAVEKPLSNQAQVSGLTREAAELRVAEHEAKLGQMLRCIEPTQLLMAVMPLMRGTSAEQLTIANLPHVWVKAIECCCANWQPAYQRPLTSSRLEAVLRQIESFEDPVLEQASRAQDSLLDFGLYVQRTQLEYQHALWWVPSGRAVRMIGSIGKSSGISSCYEQMTGLAIDRWMLLAVLFSSAANQRVMMPYLSRTDLRDLGISPKELSAFFRDVACTQNDIADAYKRVWQDKRAQPLVALHRRPYLYKRPFIQTARGIAAPVEAFVENLFGHGLLVRMLEGTPQGVHHELRAEYERYVAGMLEAMGIGRVLREAVLRMEGQKVCDCVLETTDAVIIIECKAIAFEQDAATSNAIYKWPARRRIVEGYEQVLSTAERVASGKYADLGISADKPRFGFVTTFGRVPCINSPEVWSRCFESELGSRGWSATRLSRVLNYRPEVLDGFNIERLGMSLRANGALMRPFVEERRKQSSIAIQDWSALLYEFLSKSHPPNLGYWRAPVVDMLSAAGFATPPAPLQV